MTNCHKKTPPQRGLNPFDRSGLGRRSDGANARARAAGHAGIRIDYKLAVTFGDGGNGTFLCAGAARHAFVADLICHVQYLLFCWWDYYTLKMQKMQYPKDKKCKTDKCSG
jgi:hypothetical protein